jgi:hypothetical protein
MSYDNLRRRVERAEQIVTVPHAARVDSFVRIAGHLRADRARGLDDVPDADLEVVAGCTLEEFRAAVRAAEARVGGLADLYGQIDEGGPTA